MDDFVEMMKAMLYMLLVCLLFGLIGLALSLVDDIETRGLKAALVEIWEGPAKP